MSAVRSSGHHPRTRQDSGKSAGWNEIIYTKTLQLGKEETK